MYPHKNIRVNKRVCTCKHPVRNPDWQQILFAPVIQAPIIQQYYQCIKNANTTITTMKANGYGGKHSSVLSSVQTCFSYPFTTTKHKKNRAGYHHPSYMTPFSNGIVLYYSHSITNHSELLAIYYAYI